MNLYGQFLVELSRKEVEKGAYAQVTGKLMNRTKDTILLTEVKGLEIVITRRSTDGCQKEEEPSN